MIKIDIEKLKNQDKILCICDYCGAKIEKTKKALLRGRKTVSKDACRDSSCIQLKKEECNLKKYGVKNTTTLQSVQKKLEQTNISKYGVKNPSQSEKIKNKRKETCLKRYGVETPFSSKEIQQKIKDTNLQNLGVEYPTQAESVKEKIKQTNQTKYGTDNVFQSKIVKDQIKKTNMSNLGVEYPTQSASVKQKIKNTNLQNLGVEYPTQAESVKEKIKQTNIENFGVENPLQSPEVKNKIIETCMEKYGVEYYSQTTECKNKIIETCMEKYGVEYYSQTTECKNKIIETCMEKYGRPYPIKYYGETENQIKEWINQVSGYNFQSNYTILEGKEIDLYNEELKLAIEYCGLYWHNELSPQPRDKKYHYDKFVQCKEQGVRLITIFEDEWLNREKQCKNFLRSLVTQPELKIFARKCQLQEVDKEAAKQFNEDNHIQGNSNINQLYMGLIHNDELVGLTTFSKHHRQKHESSIVLSRMCFLDGVQIVGGASKMLKACKQWAKDNNYQKIISWSDNRWSWGNVYKQSGFKQKSNLKPDYSYVNIKNPKERLSKQSQQKSKTNCPKNFTEYQWALEKGLARIWDCGKIRWEIDL